MIVRPARLDDRDGIFAVEEASFSVPWTKKAIEKELLNNGDKTIYYVLENEAGIVCGYAGLWRVLDEGQITNIALSPAARGQGYGELLLRVLMEAAWADGCNDIYVEVRISNTTALALYRKLGYTELTVRKGYYSDPVEDAFVMDCKKEQYPWIH